KPADPPKAAESKPTQAKGPAPAPAKRAPVAPSKPRAPSSPPPSDLARSSSSPLQAATDEDIRTDAGDAPAFKAVRDALKADTDENAALAQTTAGETVNLDDEPEPTIMGTMLGSEKPPPYDFSDETEVVRAGDIPVDVGSEPLLVDDIAELVDDAEDVDIDEEEEEKPAKGGRSIPPPLPRS
ncbi:MAG TPA: hypothetical protein VF407_12695, partial [Polyangiaceae bacterium]